MKITEKKRCAWCDDTEIYINYHDKEWGRPVYDDKELFEMLVLESMQAGLSWITILKKRENYRKSFDEFDYEKIALYDEEKIEELMNNEGIIRNRAKINSIINNAKIFIRIKKEYESFSKFIWKYVNDKPIVNKRKNQEDVPASTDLSILISKDLKKLGFKFLGPTTIYSFMQATGMVNDHLVSCFAYEECKNIEKENTTDEVLQIREKLVGLSEEEYKKFTASLIPGCDNILGVRIPKIRELAKEMIKENSEEDIKEYLRNNNEIYFEETMLKGLIIGNLKMDIEKVLDEISYFIPKINNWSVCDSFCTSLKIARKNKEKVWEFIKPYYKSNEAYDIRFAVVIMLFHYIEEDYILKILSICDEISHEDYYVKMAVAWAISICFVKFPTETMEYLRKNNLDDFTYNKALQKTRESLRVDKETKEVLKQMKRK